MLIQPSKVVTGDILPELPKLEYKALRSLEKALKARNWEVVNVLIHVGAALWRQKRGRDKSRQSRLIGETPQITSSAAFRA
jgi:hypothetical protein